MSDLDVKVANLQVDLAAARQDYRRLEAERDALKAEVERLRVRNTLLQDEVREWRVAAKEITEFYSERAALRGEEASNDEA